MDTQRLRSWIGAHWGFVASLLAGCMMGPGNGEVVDNTRTTSQEFLGYTNLANAKIMVEVRTNPNSASASGFKLLKPAGTPASQTFTVRASSTPSDVGEPATPAFQWAITATPSALGAPTGAFPSGGVSAFRARGEMNGPDGVFLDALSVFDTGEEAVACIFLMTGAGYNWLEAGSTCRSFYPENLVRVIDPTPNPGLTASNPALADLDKVQMPRYLSATRDRLGTALNSGGSYYNRLNNRIPLTLADFRVKYNFGLAGGNEVSALYYNYADLGLGRRMTCRNFTSTVRDKPDATGVACMVTNFAGTQFNTPFGAHNEALQATAISHAIENLRDLATVVMVFAPNQDEPVIFGAYNGEEATSSVDDGFRVGNVGSGARLNDAVLDNAARLNVDVQGQSDLQDIGNDDIPDNCLACHGGSAIVSGGIQGAMFLPFDLQNFRYATATGLTRADQEQQFRRLNALVLQTLPTGATAPRLLIDGWYANGGAPNSNGANVKTAGRTFSDSFIPFGWTEAGSGETAFAPALYKNVVEPYCQGCHISQTGEAGRLSFETFDKFNALSAKIIPAVCGPVGKSGPAVAAEHLMPHAEMTMKHFWESPARGHLLGALSAADGCENGTRN